MIAVRWRRASQNSAFGRTAVPEYSARSSLRMVLSRKGVARKKELREWDDMAGVSFDVPECQAANLKQRHWSIRRAIWDTRLVSVDWSYSDSLRACFPLK